MKKFKQKMFNIHSFTIVNCIKYSSALDICQSHNITMIPATTSKAIVHLYTLK